MRKTSIFVLTFVIYIIIAGCGKDTLTKTAYGARGEAANNAAMVISPSEKSILLQQDCKLKALVSLPDGYTEEISEYATWISSNQSIATVSNEEGRRGMVKAVSPGNVILTARFNNLISTAHLTINQIGQGPMADNAKIIFLHHSTGACIWAGGVPAWFLDYNTRQGKNYSITDQEFPKGPPYGWNNYPYDYWNIWVNNEGVQPYLQEPTLETLTQSYNVIVWKHCFPVSSILPDTGKASIQSSEKKIENYKLQYQALKEKMHSFPQTRFIVWTGAALVEGATSPDQAKLAQDFFQWVTKEWDVPGDNIYVWDFFELETDGGSFLKNEYAAGTKDSHPSQAFSKRVAPYFCKRIVDVIEGRGDAGSLTGQ